MVESGLRPRRQKTGTRRKGKRVVRGCYRSGGGRGRFLEGDRGLDRWVGASGQNRQRRYESSGVTAANS